MPASFKVPRNMLSPFVCPADKLEKGGGVKMCIHESIWVSVAKHAEQMVVSLNRGTPI